MIEIERTYLVLWTVEEILANAREHRHPIETKYVMPQAYLDDTGAWVCRVRVTRDADGNVKDYLYTMKREISAMSSNELESTVTQEFAEQFIALSVKSTNKIRHTVTIGRHNWEIDICQKGAIAGLVTVQVETASEDEDLTLPEWVGPEVTGDPQYANFNLAN